ncbi:ketopantoate reductase PanE/ApbA C terminal-domain-containing protein [Geranomyces variabilis]|nr:ketopantoate reductase PanE/ApbA C terminal-domain-containing protein [Geranomyces variabilis]KAJ3134190.1 hypothetical protein HDU90_005287 [Geranomyces variabilis]
MSLSQPSLHILGAGAIGLLHAHQLSHLNPTLLLRPAAFQAFTQCGHRIKVRTATRDASATTTIARAENLADPQNSSRPISTLLVCTKAQDALPAIQAVRTRLAPNSSVVLLQNGVLGVMDELRAADASGVGRPLRVFAASTTHGVWLSDRFSPVWAGQGETLVGGPEFDANTPDNPLAFLSPVFQSLPWPQMHHKLVRKLVVNACLNPLAAIFGVPNGALLHTKGRDLIAKICAEVAPLISLVLPTSTAHPPPLPDELIADVLKVADATATNTNSMLADIQHGRATEIDYILGYWLRIARENGHRADVLSFLYDMVKMKESATSREAIHPDTR